VTIKLLQRELQFASCVRLSSLLQQADDVACHHLQVVDRCLLEFFETAGFSRLFVKAEGFSGYFPGLKPAATGRKPA